MWHEKSSLDRILEVADAKCADAKLFGKRDRSSVADKP
jgi:hypothetical protein